MTRRDLGLNLGWVDQQGLRVDVDEDRRASLIDDAVGGRGEGHGRYDDFVSWSDVQGVNGSVERGRAVADRDGLADAGRLGKGSLELADHGAGGEPVRTQHGHDGRDVVVVDRLASVGQQLLTHGRAAVNS